MLLVSDANIFIDLEVSGLTRRLFQLPHEIVVPDTLYDQELKLRHAHLLTLGLQLRVLTGDQVAHVFDLQAKYPGPSVNDLFALVLAKSLACPLATGDARLRQAAAAEGLELIGTLTLLDQMVTAELIALEDLHLAYQRMRARRESPTAMGRSRSTACALGGYVEHRWRAFAETDVAMWVRARNWPKVWRTSMRLCKLPVQGGWRATSL